MRGIKKLTLNRLGYGTSIAIKAGIFILAILLIFKLDFVHITAIGSSTFAAFCFGTQKTATARHMIWSYVVSILIGIACAYSYMLFGMEKFLLIKHIIGAFCVIFSIFFMVLFGIDHPPAVGAALGFLAGAWDWFTPIALIASIILLVLYRWVINRFANYLTRLRNK